MDLMGAMMLNGFFGAHCAWQVPKSQEEIEWEASWRDYELWGDEEIDKTKRARAVIWYRRPWLHRDGTLGRCAGFVLRVQVGTFEPYYERYLFIERQAGDALARLSAYGYPPDQIWTPLDRSECDRHLTGDERQVAWNKDDFGRDLAPDLPKYERVGSGWRRIETPAATS